MRRDRGGRIRVVGGSGDAPLECCPGRLQVAARLRHETDDPLGDSRQVRVADTRRQVARVGRRAARCVEIARAQRDDAPLDERPRPERIRKAGRRQRGIEVAGGRAEVAAPPLDAPESDLDARQRVGFGSGCGGLEGGDRRGVVAESRPKLPDPGVDRCVVARRERSPPRGGRSPRGWRKPPRLGRRPRRRRRRPRPAGPPPAHGRRSGRTASGRRARRPRLGLIAAAARRWSSRRRARLVASYATSRIRPWTKS